MKRSRVKISDSFIFGMPILEAFYHATAVVTLNVTAMPEIAGNAAVYVDPESVESILVFTLGREKICVY